MTAEEKLKEQIHDLIGDCLIEIGCGDTGCPKAERIGLEAQETLLNAIMGLIANLGEEIKDGNTIRRPPDRVCK